jgi:hypothetical protein
MDNEIMKSLGDIEILLAKGEFSKQNKSVQEQIFSLYFGAKWYQIDRTYMVSVLESYKN